jgi:hypothetical protein
VYFLISFCTLGLIVAFYHPSSHPVADVQMAYHYKIIVVKVNFIVSCVIISAFDFYIHAFVENSNNKANSFILA